jgi:uncharacterized protein (TIGR02679 family)
MTLGHSAEQRQRHLDDVTGGEGWPRLLATARRRLEATGGLIDGTVGLRGATEAERRVIIGITGAHRSASAGQLRVALADLDDWLRDATGLGLVDVLSLVDSRPLRDRPAERRQEAAAREATLAATRHSVHAESPWFEAWLNEVSGDGTLTRLVRRGADDLIRAVAVLDLLPAEEIPLPVLAEVSVGDTKALSGTPLAALVLRAVAAWQAVEVPASAEDERALWDSAGVIVDDLASQVLVLNLPARGGLVADWLTSAAAAGIPFRATLHQLRTSPVVPVPATVYVCENPAVLRAAAIALGSGCAALICAEGVASVACRHLVASCRRAGATIRWRNDFDWPGLRMTAAAVTRFSAVPWRMGAQDYDQADGEGAPLRGAAAASPWDPGLAVSLARTGRAVMEERLIPELLRDLRTDPGDSATASPVPDHRGRRGR